MTSDPPPFRDPSLARYSRQMLVPSFGEAGQKRLKHSSVTLIGCGALGGVIANSLVRAGIGKLRIVDRDFIELDNLQRQILFDEHDLAQNLPKAEAAGRKLRKINSAVEIEAVVDDANHLNILSLCRDCDLILDGADNFETRFLVNDAAVKLGLPWVYGACIAGEGLVMAIIPHDTPCLRCVWEDAPPPGTTPTCDTAGVLGPVVEIVASFQVLEAMKILIGAYDAKTDSRGAATPAQKDARPPYSGFGKGCMLTIDGWSGRVRSLDMQSARGQGECVCCKQGRFEYLSGEKTSASVSLCGRNAVQILPPPGATIDFRRVAERLKSGAAPEMNAFMLRFRVEPYQVTLFADGRAIVQGTADAATARGVYAKYVGA
ncbi:putative adenylyltransferase/sulfurtransferase MoeZ [Phycisphaerae bacterium RAS1]|nr:putative adenylyltransferase/sulfurtransferase MoeZ [Phycisphaerae bacterium RAS1]